MTNTYNHPEHPGTWRIQPASPDTVTLRDADGHTLEVPADSWPGDWRPRQWPLAQASTLKPEAFEIAPDVLAARAGF